MFATQLQLDETKTHAIAGSNLDVKPFDMANGRNVRAKIPIYDDNFLVIFNLSQGVKAAMTRV